MAIFRGGVKIFGTEVNLGLGRDLFQVNYDNITTDPRFEQKEGGQIPENPNLRSTQPALINQMLQYIMQGEGLARPNKYYASFRLPGGATDISQRINVRFDPVRPGPGRQFENDLAVENGGFATGNITKQVQDQDGRRVNAFCKEITLPDRTMTTEAITTGAGPARYFVTDHTYGDLTATFYADKYLRERNYFEIWQKAAFNDLTNNYEFYDNYTEDIDIFNLGQFSNSEGTSEDPRARDDLTHGVKLYDCYPTSIGAPTLAYATTDSVLEFTVTFKYRMWQNYFINKTADVALGDGGFDKSVSDERDTRLQVSGGLLGSLTSLLPPALRGVANRAGRDVLNDLKRRIPLGDLTGGRVFPPFF